MVGEWFVRNDRKNLLNKVPLAIISRSTSSGRVMNSQSAAQSPGVEVHLRVMRLRDQVLKVNLETGTLETLAQRAR